MELEEVAPVRHWRSGKDAFEKPFVGHTVLKSALRENRKIDIQDSFHAPTHDLSLEFVKLLVRSLAERIERYRLGYRDDRRTGERAEPGKSQGARRRVGANGAAAESAAV